MKTLFTKGIVTALLSLLVAVPVFAQTTPNPYPAGTVAPKTKVTKKVVTKKVVKAKVKVKHRVKRHRRGVKASHQLKASVDK